MQTNPLIMLFALTTAGLPVSIAAAAAPPETRGAEVSQAVQHDTSRPIDRYEHVLETFGHRVVQLRPVPHPEGPANVQDPVVQSEPGTPAATGFSGAFDGVGKGFTGPQGTFQVNAAPPDTNGAAGLTQYVQTVNTSFAVFDKPRCIPDSPCTPATPIYGPVAINTMWSGFGGPCETHNDGDPIVQYDKAADRWIISQFALPNGGPYFQCVAVSTTSDATGEYHRYAFQYTDFPDYPKIGVWPDAYYVTFNMFAGTRFRGARVCAYDRASMLVGADATQQCFQLSSSFASLLPADLDGVVNPPPSGSPNYLLNRGANSLNLWRLKVDWSHAANSTLTGPINIPVAANTAACSGGACIPQPGTGTRLDSLGDRLMYRLAYRNFPKDHEALVVSHAVNVGTKRSLHTGVRWYELRNPAGTPVVVQQGTFAPDSDYRWMSSIAMDKAGNIAMGYSVSSSRLFPSLRFTGRVPTDPAGTMQDETEIIAGGGSQTGNLDRWGDYASMAIDPVDDCTFWFTSEYLKASGSFNWSTRIASFTFPGCQ